jgi:WD40 repeat protein
MARRWAGFGLLALLIVCAVGVSAQADTPVATLDAGDLLALTISDDQRYLLAADARTEQVRVYDLTRLSAPSLITTLTVEGQPLALASADGFILAAVRSSFSPSTLEVVAPARYQPGSVLTTGENFVDLPFVAQSLVLSGDRRFALAIGESGFVLLALRAADEIDARTFDTQIDAAALTRDRLIYAQGTGIATLLLDGLNTARPTAIIDVGAAVRALAASPDGRLIAAALEDGTIRLLDPVTLTSRASAALPGVSLLTFSTTNGALRLVAGAERERALTVFTVTADSLTRQPSELTLPRPVQAIAAFDDHFAATDGRTIVIFALR